MENQIRKETTRSAITVDKVEKTMYSKSGIESAQLRQEVKTRTSYPTAKVGSSLEDNLFNVNEFNISAKDYESSETRIAWIDVPQGTTIEQVTERLKNAPTARIYKILSNNPILHDGQKQAIQSGLKTMDDFADSQVVRYPATHPTMANQIILDKNGKVQYRANFFSLTAKDDEDLRTNDDQCYMSEAIKAEVLAAAEADVEQAVAH